ncbi:MAG: hypothetical protein ACI89X_002922 [Planctomycetota bacterium]|jgi:hypothetical protein
MPPVCTTPVPSSKLAVLLVLAAATGAVFWFNGQDTATPVVPRTKTDKTIEVVTDSTSTIAAADTIIDGKVVRDVPSTDDARTDLPQGIKGRVLLPNGTPAVGHTVMLMPNLRSDPIKVYLMAKSGQVVQPLAIATTHSDGSFALGIQKPSESVDLRVTSVDYPEITRAPIDVSIDEWHDVGDLTLQQGLVVQGRVRDATTNTIINNATVYLEPNQNLLATPDHHRGTSMDVAADGSFRFFNAPKLGLVDLVVEAGGYAPHRLVRQQLHATAANDFTIKMQRGHPLTGIVVDPQGTAIQDARVTALALSAKTPHKETVYSDADGQFEFVALAAGPYRLDTTARNHANTTTPLALTDEDIQVVMIKRSVVKLRVLAHDGRDVKSYRLSLKRSFKNGIGNVFDYRDRNISPRDYTGKWAIIENMPDGQFCFQLSDRKHAKTLSPTFEVVAGSDNIEVIATLTTGAEITGTVIDGQGNPVAGASVATHRDGMGGFASGVLGVLGTMIPEKHQTRSTKTDKQGRFRLKALSFADYMVTATHPNYCKASAKKIKLVIEGQVVDAGVLQMEQGAILTGITTKLGAPVGQVDIKVATPPAVIQEASVNNTPVDYFSAQARSDNTGSYRFLHRLPPGRYWITASRAAPSNPFDAIIQIKQTGRELIVRPGQETVEVSFDLPNFGN